MITHNLGYPRIGNLRETKKVIEDYWTGKIDYEQLILSGKKLRVKNWFLQKELGLDLIPSNDFSFYDHILDMILTVGAIPERFQGFKMDSDKTKLELYFAMARGYQKNGSDIFAMEMSKWFDTNYHYIVPEFYKNQIFRLSSFKFMEEYTEAKDVGIITKPVLIGPVSFLLLGKEKESGFDRIELIESLLKVYIDMITMLQSKGLKWIQFDEPFLVMDLSQKQREVFTYTYTRLRKEFPTSQILVATYFGSVGDNLDTLLQLPVSGIHIDLVKDPQQLDSFLEKIPSNTILSMGIVDGRNIWKNDYKKSLELINKAINKIGEDKILLAPSCSLLHVPCDLGLETDTEKIPNEIKQWLAFAKQKIEEIVDLKKLSVDNLDETNTEKYIENQNCILNRKLSKLIHNKQVRYHQNNSSDFKNFHRTPFSTRNRIQRESFNFPLFPTTTIGSFPQTKEIRTLRLKMKKGEITREEYENFLKQEIIKTIEWQEKIGFDVLVHGEFERNDMVEYFGEKLNGFIFTQNGWVQSYGSRCVKPPIIYGDISRPEPMTVEWITFAQSLTKKPVKGMLTGPVTILHWSFVRDDQPSSETGMQIALVVNDEVKDLEKAGIRIIQIDEPALREGLPLRKKDWNSYFDWAIGAFKLSYSGVKDTTQIHTHMCYSEFSDIINKIAELDADVISIECSRSQMELLNTFSEYHYPNEIGPGIYDIHSPRIPSKDEYIILLDIAIKRLSPEKVWVNPDCGLKTRDWKETEAALSGMVEAVKEMRKKYK